MTMTFWQQAGLGQLRCIGSKEWRFTSIPDAIDDVRRRLPWGNRRMTVVLPHDGRFGAAELFEIHGHEPIVLPRSRNVAAEIEMVRSALSRMYIDNAVRPWTDNAENNERLVEALCGYRTARSNTDDEVYQLKPSHTWESHYADSVRYFVVAESTEVVGNSASQWGPAPNYAQRDRAVI